uniref:Death domain-containing protein n=1 Tax=Amphimedon queenslandica TaxID=400682 RepID=A0A1X7TTF0_AMPQE
MKAVVQGEARVGKTCFKSLLLDEKYIKASTGIAEPRVGIYCYRRDTGKRYKLLDVTELEEIVKNALEKDAVEKWTNSPVENQASEGIDQKKPTGGNETADEDDDGFVEGNEATNEPGDGDGVPGDGNKAPGDEKESSPSKEVKNVLDEVQKCSGKENRLEGAQWLYLVDTGGQIAFQKLLPIFMPFAQVLILVVNISKELSSGSTAVMHIKGEDHSDGSPSRLTVEEVLKQIISSIASGMQHFRDSYKDHEVLRDLVPEKLQILTIGTHGDECSDVAESKRILAKKLSEIIKGNDDCESIEADHVVRVREIDGRIANVAVEERGKEENFTNTKSSLDDVDEILMKADKGINIPFYYYFFDVILRVAAKEGCPDILAGIDLRYYHEALKTTVKCHLTKAVVQGEACVGKTCFKSLLLDEKYVKASTGIAEPRVGIYCYRRDTGKRYKLLDVTELEQIVKNALKKDAEKKSTNFLENKVSDEDETSDEDDDEAPGDGNKASSDGNEAPGEVLKEKKAPGNENEVPEKAPKGNEAPSDKKETVLSQEVEKVLDEVQKCSGKENRLEGAQWLYLIDTGGQIAFQKLLPIFMPFAQVLILVVNISKELSSGSTAVMHIEGKDHSDGSPSRLTVEEVLKQIISSIASGMQHFRDSYKDHEVLRDLVPEKLQILTIGTHGDECSDVAESTHKMEEKLAEIIKGNDDCESIEADHVVRVREIDGRIANVAVEERGKEKNFKNTKSSLDDVDEILTKDDKGINIPFYYYFFDVILRVAAKEGCGVLRLSTCKSLGKDLKLKEKEVMESLNFLHYINSIIYYHDSKACSDLVFVNIGSLIGILKELVGRVHTLHSITRRYAGNEDVMKGILSKSKFKEICKEQLNCIRKELKVNNIATKFLNLFQELSIATRIDDKYFIPALLPMRDVTDTNPYKNHEPLLFYFKKATPMGLFCSVVTRLLSRPCYKIVLIESNFSNFIELKYFTERVATFYITLVEQIDCIEVHCEEQRGEGIVREDVKKAIASAAEKHNLSASQEIRFYCSCGRGTTGGGGGVAKGKKHTVTVETVYKEHIFRCSENPRIKCQEKKELWSSWLDKLSSGSTAVMHIEGKDHSDGSPSILTVEDVMKQIISSIASGMQHFRDSYKDHEVLRDLVPEKLQILTIGTHGDECSDVAESTHTMEEKLAEIIKGNDDCESIEADHVVCVRGIDGRIASAAVEERGNEKNFKNTKSSLDNVDEILTKDDEGINIPFYYYFFDIVLRVAAKEGCGVLRLSTCERLGKDLKLEEKELMESLNFLHHINSIIYYHDSKACSDLVFVNIGSLIGILKELIGRVHVVHSKAKKIAGDEDVIKGILSKSKFKEICKEQLDPITKELKVDDIATKLLNLFQELSIATQIDDKYFIPALLPVKDVTNINPYKNRAREPLLFYFKKATPMGLFCSVVNHLLSNFSYKIASIESNFSNCIELEYRTEVVARFFVVLVEQVNCIEVHCEKQRGEGIVREDVKTAIASAAEKHNLSASHKIRFYCSCGHGTTGGGTGAGGGGGVAKGKKHTVEIETVSKEHIFRCSENPHICSDDLPTEWEHKIELWSSWLDAVTPNTPPSNDESTSPTKQTTAQQSLDITDLQKVLNLLRETHFNGDWEGLGLELGLYQHPTLSNLQHTHDRGAALRECLAVWLQRADGVDKNGGANYVSLANAVERLGQRATAGDIRRRCGIETAEEDAPVIETGGRSPVTALPVQEDSYIAEEEEKPSKKEDEDGGGVRQRSTVASQEQEQEQEQQEKTPPHKVKKGSYCNWTVLGGGLGFVVFLIVLGFLAVRAYGNEDISLDVTNLQEILEVLREGLFPDHRWLDLGLSLNLIHNDLSVIESDRPTAHRRLQEMLSLWLRRGRATWNGLAAALDNIEEYKAAKVVKAKGMNDRYEL